MRTEQTPAGPVDHRRLFLGSELPATGVSKSWWTKVRGRGPDMVLSWGSAHPTPPKTAPGSPNDAGEKLGAPEPASLLGQIWGGKRPPSLDPGSSPKWVSGGHLGRGAGRGARLILPSLWNTKAGAEDPTATDFSQQVFGARHFS